MITQKELDNLQIGCQYDLILSGELNTLSYIGLDEKGYYGFEILVNKSLNADCIRLKCYHYAIADESKFYVMKEGSVNGILNLTKAKTKMKTKLTKGLIVLGLIVWTVYGVYGYIHRQIVQAELLNEKETETIVNELKAPTHFLKVQTLLRKKKKEKIANYEDDIIALYSQIEARKESQNILKVEVNDIIEPKIRCGREAFYKDIDCTKEYDLYLGN